MWYGIICSQRNRKLLLFAPTLSTVSATNEVCLVCWTSQKCTLSRGFWHRIIAEILKLNKSLYSSVYRYIFMFGKILSFVFVFPRGFFSRYFFLSHVYKYQYVSRGEYYLQTRGSISDQLFPIEPCFFLRFFSPWAVVGKFPPFQNNMPYLWLYWKLKRSVN